MTTPILSNCVRYPSTAHFYRTNRFDLFSHYVRAYDKNQVVPLTSLSQFEDSYVGRVLISLLDQHISDTDALTVQSLQSKGVFDVLSAEQLSFIQQEQEAQLLFIPGFTPEAIVARQLLKLRLLARSRHAPGGSDSNVGTTPEEILELSAAFNPVVDVINNGVEVIRIIANVYAARKAGINPDILESAITRVNVKNYDDFGDVVAASKFFQSHEAENLATLESAGLTSSGNAAQDVWNAHLVQVALMIDAESNFDMALKNELITSEFPGEYGQALEEANEAVLMHAPQLAGLFALSLGVPTEGSVAAFPTA